MGDASYKARKREAWIKAGRCRGCGRVKAPEANWCVKCQRSYDARLAEKVRSDTDNRNKPRVDGNWIYL